MSYGAASALQAAVYQALSTDGAIAALIGAAVYDSVPPGTATGTYVSLGPEDVSDASDMTGNGAIHDFVVSVVTDEAGFQRAKAVAGAVSDVLTGASLVLGRGTLVGLWFRRARARRVETGATRRIDLYFRARVDER